MGNIKIIKGVFDTKLELEHAGVAAGMQTAHVWVHSEI
jgi:hypothetical protein